MRVNSLVMRVNVMNYFELFRAIRSNFCLEDLEALTRLVGAQLSVKPTYNSKKGSGLRQNLSLRVYRS